MRDPDLLAAIGPVAKAFETLGVLYYIGGSLASSAYGAPRATLDVDMVSDLKPQHVRSLVKMLESSYYIDEDAILEAIHRHSSFNLIHLETMIKVDVFLASETNLIPSKLCDGEEKTPSTKISKPSNFIWLLPKTLFLSSWTGIAWAGKYPSVSGVMSWES
jgi:hypothetical protein